MNIRNVANPIKVVLNEYLLKQTFSLLDRKRTEKKQIKVWIR